MLLDEVLCVELVELDEPVETVSLQTAPPEECELCEEAGGAGGATLVRGGVARGTEGSFPLPVEPPTLADGVTSVPRWAGLTSILVVSAGALPGALLFTKRCCAGS